MEKFNSYALQRSMGQQLIEYARRGCHSLVWPTTCVSSSAGAPMIQGNFPLLGSSKAKSTIERCPSKDLCQTTLSSPACPACKVSLHFHPAILGRALRSDFPVFSPLHATHLQLCLQHGSGFGTLHSLEQRTSLYTRVRTVENQPANTSTWDLSQESGGEYMGAGVGSILAAHHCASQLLSYICTHCEAFHWLSPRAESLGVP